MRLWEAAVPPPAGRGPGWWAHSESEFVSSPEPPKLGHAAYIWTMAFSRDGRRLATASEVRRSDLATHHGGLGQLQASRFFLAVPMKKSQPSSDLSDLR